MDLTCVSSIALCRKVPSNLQCLFIYLHTLNLLCSPHVDSWHLTQCMVFIYPYLSSPSYCFMFLLFKCCIFGLGKFSAEFGLWEEGSPANFDSLKIHCHESSSTWNQPSSAYLYNFIYIFATFLSRFHHTGSTCINKNKLYETSPAKGMTATSRFAAATASLKSSHWFAECRDKRNTWNSEDSRSTK